VNTEQLRLLECWLPLAQELNTTLGWGADAAALESLIERAAPALRMATTTEEARAFLMLFHASMGYVTGEHLSCIKQLAFPTPDEIVAGCSPSMAKTIPSKP
jgi:hypothetical protein